MTGYIPRPPGVEAIQTFGTTQERMRAIGKRILETSNGDVSGGKAIATLRYARMHLDSLLHDLESSHNTTRTIKVKRLDL